MAQGAIPKGRGLEPHSCQIVEHDMTTIDARFNITTIRMQLIHNPRSLAHKQNANFTWTTLSKQRILHAFWNPRTNYMQKIKKPKIGIGQGLAQSPITITKINVPHTHVSKSRKQSHKQTAPPSCRQEQTHTIMLGQAVINKPGNVQKCPQDHSAIIRRICTKKVAHPTNTINATPINNIPKTILKISGNNIVIKAQNNQDDANNKTQKWKWQYSGKSDKCGHRIVNVKHSPYPTSKAHRPCNLGKMAVRKIKQKLK